MNPERKYGQTEFEPVHILQPAVFDFFDGRPLPPGLGQTEMPVTILPAWEIDMSEAVVAPLLALTLHLHPEATPGAVAVDLFRVWKVLNEYELSLGGAGLNPGEPRDEQTADGTVIRLVLTCSEPTGAAGRLTKLAAVVNDAADPTIPKVTFTGRAEVA